MSLPLRNLCLDAEQLRADKNNLLALLFHEGVLDDNFRQLLQLQDAESPNFVAEVANIFFCESEKDLKDLRSLLMHEKEIDYNKVAIHLSKLQGSSSSIGASRVSSVCVALRSAFEQRNRKGCLRALTMLDDEYCYLKNKLIMFFQMEQQRSSV